MCTLEKNPKELCKRKNTPREDGNLNPSWMLWNC